MANGELATSNERHRSSGFDDPVAVQCSVASAGRRAAKQNKRPQSEFLELTDQLRENVSARCNRRTILTVSWTSVWRELFSCISDGCADKHPRRMTACTSEGAKQLSQTFFCEALSSSIRVVRDSRAVCVWIAERWCVCVSDLAAGRRAEKRCGGARRGLHPAAIDRMGLRAGRLRLRLAALLVHSSESLALLCGALHPVQQLLHFKQTQSTATNRTAQLSVADSIRSIRLDSIRAARSPSTPPCLALPMWYTCE